MAAQALKVGALAKRTGLTVRTLHHYDEIGLLRPSSRTASGHRVYAEADVRRLQQIASLKQLGLTLEEIRTALARPGQTLEHTLALHLERIEEEILRQERLRDLVRHLRDCLSSHKSISVDELTRTIEVTLGFEKYYTVEQMERLRRRADEVGEQRMRQAQGEWSELLVEYRRAMESGLEPSSDEVRALADRSAALVEEFTGGDAGIHASLTRMYREDGADTVLSGRGLDTDGELWRYMAAARAARESDQPG